MKISVVTAVYNRVGVIRDAIQSVSCQDYPDIEHVIVDGASSDGTMDVIRESTSCAATVISEPDRGIYDALNKGIRAATGDVIGLLHSDDVFADGGVIAEVAERFRDPAVNVVYGDLDYVDRHDPTRIVRHWVAGEHSPAQLRSGWMPPHPTVFVRSNLYRAIGNFQTKFRISADYDLMLRLFMSGKVNSRYVPHVLVKMRTGGESNRSVGRIVRKSREDFEALRGNGFSWPGATKALVMKNFSKLGQFFGN